MVELRLLGGLELGGEGAKPLAAILAQPKRVALLAYLALAPGQGFRRRDSIAALFWPDQDQEHARGSLRQAVRFLRRELGDDAIVNRGEEEIGLNTAAVWCDVVAFERAVATDQMDEAVRLYRDGLLVGFYVADSAPEFDEWLEGERNRIRALAAQALWAVVERRKARGDTSEAIAAARRAVSLTPDDESGVRRLLALLDDAGDRAGAMAAYEQFAERLHGEYEAEPSAETQKLIVAIRSRTSAHDQPLRRPAAQSASSAPATFVGVSPRRLRALPLAAIVGGAVLMLGAYFAVAAFRGDRRRDHPMTIAVLPVRDLSGDTATAVFRDALTDELITDLAQISAFRVINRGTMMRLADSVPPADSLLRRLGTDAVVTTTVQRSGDSLRLRTHLVVVGDPRVSWARSFAGNRRGAFDWQKAVAVAVAEWAQIKLLPMERAGLAARRELDPDAFEAYARGRWWWNKRGREGLSKADTFFHQALEREPTYALAWSGLADTYVQLGYGGYLAPDEAFPKAKAMAKRALELDSTLAEPHAALGYALMYFDWNWRGAEREYSLAIARRPSHATAHEWYGLFLAAMGRFPEAERETRLATELDPLSASVAATRGWVLHYAGKNDDALRVLRAAARTDAKNSLVRLYLGRVHQSLGQLDSAKMNFDIGRGRIWIPSVAGDGVLAAQQGHAAEAHGSITRLDSMARAGWAETPYGIALVYAALGQKDSAFDRLEHAFDERVHWMVWLNRDARWKPLRGDPRFNTLIQRVGLPP